jgi:transmembrane sensor
MNNETDDSSSPSRGPGSGARSPRLHPIDWAIAAKAVDDVWRETQLKVRRRQRQRLQVAAGSLVVALVAAGFLWRGWRNERQPSGAAQETIAATRSAVLMPEQRLLTDGSKVDLKPGAEVRVAYTETARTVALLRGEAHFEVMKDARRSFVVQVGGVEVRAVGTAFSVQLETRQVDVLVTEGRVAVERAPAATGLPAEPAMAATPPPALALVEAGRRVVIKRDAPAATVPPVVEQMSTTEIDERLAWRAPRLDFTRTPLVEALPLINRHSRTQVKLSDPALGSVRLSGILRADNVETLLRLLEAEHGLRAEWHGTAEVVLYRTP